MKMKKHFTSEFKARVALMAIKGVQSLSKICSDYKVSNSAALKWKNQLTEQAFTVFDNKAATKEAQERDKKEEELYSQIGKLQMQVDYLKKAVL